MYADDYDGRGVGHASAINDPIALDQIGPAHTYSRAALNPYMKNQQIWRCPSEQSIEPWGLPSEVAETSMIYAGFGSQRVWQMPSACDPSVAPVVWDIQPWHAGQRNIGYYDGHVKNSGAATMLTVSPIQAWDGRTGVHLNAGDSFQISAGGQWSTDAPSVPLSFTTPSGKSSWAPPDMIRGDMSEGGLIGAVGASIFYVGYGGTFTASQSGELVLSMNDNPRLCGNNAGTVWAFIW
jgi:prepilin-type processing-associated H-X9-DG protein